MMPTIQPLFSDQPLPLLVQAEDAADARGLISWYQDHQDELDAGLLEHGAILFRGFHVETPAAFARVTRAISSGLKECSEENVPRTKLTSGVYTSTEYPAEYFLSMHSEYSYSKHFPRRLYFCSITAAQEGGATPLADNREVMRVLDPEIIAAFKNKRVKYLRNLHGGQGFGLSWQTAFQTSDKAEVEAYCLESEIELTWKDDGGVRLSQTLDGIIAHPQTGEDIWFNQAPQFHPSDYPPEIHQSLLASYNDGEDLPQNVCFGDDTPIPVEMLDTVRETMKGKAISFPWQEGDLLMLDNVRISHGREPFKGPRKTLVAMS